MFKRDVGLVIALYSFNTLYFFLHIMYYYRLEDQIQMNTPFTSVIQQSYTVIHHSYPILIQ